MLDNALKATKLRLVICVRFLSSTILIPRSHEQRAHAFVLTSDNKNGQPKWHAKTNASTNDNSVGMDISYKSCAYQDVVVELCMHHSCCMCFSYIVLCGKDHHSLRNYFSLVKKSVILRCLALTSSTTGRRPWMTRHAGFATMPLESPSKTSFKTVLDEQRLPNECKMSRVNANTDNCSVAG